MIAVKTLEIYPGEGFAVQNITSQVDEFVQRAGVQQGQLLAFIKHTTGAIFIGEHEAGIIADIENLFEDLTPTNGSYVHHLRQVDFNGFAHVRAALMPTSVTVPIVDGQLAMGTHQEILVMDSQPEAFARFIVLQVSGE